MLSNVFHIDSLIIIPSSREELSCGSYRNVNFICTQTWLFVTGVFFGKAMLCDCGILWVSSFIGISAFLQIIANRKQNDKQCTARRERLHKYPGLKEFNSFFSRADSVCNNQGGLTGICHSSRAQKNERNKPMLSIIGKCCEVQIIRPILLRFFAVHIYNILASTSRKRQYAHANSLVSYKTNILRYIPYVTDQFRL